MRYVSLITGEERERPSERAEDGGDHLKSTKFIQKVYRMGRAEMHAGARVHMPANESPPDNSNSSEWVSTEKDLCEKKNVSLRRFTRSGRAVTSMDVTDSIH